LESTKKALITGASGGLGRATTSLLIRKGWHVFAADLELPDPESMEDPEKVSAIRMDVTSESSVRDAFQVVTERTGHLDAIIHMAGILRVGSLVEIPENDLKQSLEINLMGAFRVNKQFLPLILPKNGRIILVSSEVGTQTAAPFNGPYAISKHALEAYSDALRRELAILGIRVIKVQPGPFRTGMTESGEQRFKEAATASIYFSEPLARGAEYLPRIYKKAHDPSRIARIVTNALISRRPNIRYAVKQDPMRKWLDKLPVSCSDYVIKKVLSSKSNRPINKD